MINEYGCDRARYIKLWEADPESRCVTRKNMDNMVAVEQVSMNLMAKYGFCLDTVPTTAAIQYYRIKDKKLKLRVLKRMQTAITEHVHPLTGKPLSEHGLTAPMLREIIRFESGLPPDGRFKRTVTLYTDDIALLKSVIRKATVDARRAGTKTDVENLTELQRKILGPKWS